MTRSTTKLLVLAAVLALGACARQDAARSTSEANRPAGTTTDRTMTGSAEANDPTAQMFQRIHMVNLMEMDAGKLAVERATSQKVREYGTMLVRDHQNADQRIQKLATDRGVTLASDMQDARMQSGSGTEGATGRESGTAHGSGGASEGSMMGAGGDDMHESMAAMEKLKTMRGRDFDLTFMQQMVKDHDKVLSMLESFRPQIQDTAIQQEAQQLMTSIRQHRDQAQTIFASLPGASDRKDVRGTDPKSGASPVPAASPVPRH
jgi:putative membrane protein